MSFTKTLALCLSLLLLAGGAITGTLAFPNFLSDSEPDEAAVDRVKIQLQIAQDAGDIYPGVDFRKAVSIASTAESTVSAYAWYTYAAPKALILPGFDAQPLTGSFAKDTPWLNNAPVYDGAQYREVTLDGREYIEFTCLYPEPLPPGAATEVSLETVLLDARVDVQNGAYSWAENGSSVDLNYSDSAIKMYFNARAISAAGYQTVQEAYAAYNRTDVTAPVDAAQAN